MILQVKRLAFQDSKVHCRWTLVFLTPTLISALTHLRKTQLLLRKVVTCSPIHVQDYLEVRNNTGDARFLLQVYNIGSVKETTGYTYTYQTHTAVDTVGDQIT
jgi:hypothetical protein